MANHWRASIAGAAAAALTAAAIWLGSRGLRHFDAALVGYAAVCGRRRSAVRANGTSATPSPAA
jgi:hypothetical protein